MTLNLKGFGSFLNYEKRAKRHTKTKQVVEDLSPLCGHPHMNNSSRRCTLPLDHDKWVELPTMPIPFHHADLSNPDAVIGWLEK